MRVAPEMPAIRRAGSRLSSLLKRSGKVRRLRIAGCLGLAASSHRRFRRIGNRLSKAIGLTSTRPLPLSYHRRMTKRIMVAIIGAGMGAMVGLLADYLGGGNLALIGGAVAGAVIPLVLLGQPGH